MAYLGQCAGGRPSLAKIPDWFAVAMKHIFRESRPFTLILNHSGHLRDFCRFGFRDWLAQGLN